IVLLVKPSIVHLLLDDPAPWLPFALSATRLGLVALYVLASRLRLAAIRIGRLHMHYPELAIVKKQLLIGPLELLRAAAILFFAVPRGRSPVFLIVLRALLGSFSPALVSSWRGGLRLLETIFLLAFREVTPADIIAALLVFRLFYLLSPFAIS